MNAIKDADTEVVECQTFVLRLKADRISLAACCTLPTFLADLAFLINIDPKTNHPTFTTPARIDARLGLSLFSTLFVQVMSIQSEQSNKNTTFPDPHSARAFR